MKSHVVLFAMLGLCLGPFTWAAQKVQKKVNFSGTWILDTSKSSQKATMQGGGGMGRGGSFPGGGYPRGGRTGGGRTGGGRPGGGGEGNIPGMTAQTTYSILVIEHTTDALKVTNKTSNAEGGEQLTQVFKLDGGESVNPGFLAGGEVRSRTSWDKDKLVTLGTQRAPGASGSGGQDIVIKQEFSLSKDGKTLTVKTTETAARGQINSKEVYVKQTETAK
jgi:hypothetical protein